MGARLLASVARRSGAAGVSNEIKLVQLPKRDLCNLPLSLRNLADSIESGSFGDAHNLFWVIDCGDGRIEIGLLGQCADYSATAYLLNGLARKKIEEAAR